MSGSRQKQITKTTPSNSHLWAGKTPENTPIVGVEWRDIVDIANWNDEVEVAPARAFYSIGYLLYEGPDPKDEDNDMTVIAVGYDHDANKWNGYTVFPSVVIRKITRLTRKRARR